MAHILAVGDTRDANQKLVEDVRPTVENWLVEDYTKTQPVQLEKQEVLAVIDAAEHHANFCRSSRR